jgi:hypothetical protein
MASEVSFDIVAEWRPRPEPLQWLSHRICETLDAITQRDGRLEEWRLKRGSLRRGRGPSNMIEVSEAGVADLLRRGSARNHDLERGLGYSLSVFNTRDGAEAVGIHFVVGSTSDSLPLANRVHVGWIDRVGPELSETVEHLMQILVVAWEPDSVGVQTAGGDPPRVAVGDCTPMFDWMLYCRKEWAPRVGAIEGVEEFMQMGWILRVQPDPPQWSEKSVKERVHALRRVVRRALPKAVSGL